MPKPSWSWSSQPATPSGGMSGCSTRLKSFGPSTGRSPGSPISLNGLSNEMTTEASSFPTRGTPLPHPASNAAKAAIRIAAGVHRDVIKLPKAAPSWEESRRSTGLTSKPGLSVFAPRRSKGLTPLGELPACRKFSAPCRHATSERRKFLRSVVFTSVRAPDDCCATRPLDPSPPREIHADTQRPPNDPSETRPCAFARRNQRWIPGTGGAGPSDQSDFLADLRNHCRVCPSPAAPFERAGERATESRGRSL